MKAPKTDTDIRHNGHTSQPTEAKLNPQFDDNTSGSNGDHAQSIIDHVDELLKKGDPAPHGEILSHLIEKVEPVDFRKLANLPGEDKVLNSHYQIITVEEVQRLANENRWDICRNHEFIYLFNGAYWSLTEVEEWKTFLGEAAEKMGVDKFKARYYNFRDSLYKQFMATATLPKPEPTKDAVFINLKNCTFEIKGGKTKQREFRRKDFITYQLPFDYDPDARAPMFKAYLNKVLPDKERQQILSEYLGYVFIHTSTLKLEKALILYGPGANGKSVFYDIIKALLGEHNTSDYSLQSLTNDNGYYRASISNKLVNYASEINGKLETSFFKQLVSGEPVEARLPYGNPFTVTRYAKLIFNCNELPSDIEQTMAFFRRFLIIPFEVTIPEAEQDKQLAQKIIESELSGIFNWALEGLNRLLKQKRFTRCEAAEKALQQYKKESDSVKMFLEDHSYSASSTDTALIKDLYREYRSFCTEDGLMPVKKLNFINRLKNSNIVIEKKNIGIVAFLTKPIL